MKTLAEKIAVMQAAERGEKIESKYIALQCPEAAWCPNSKPVWDWINFDYRVAPRTKEIVVVAWKAHPQSAFVMDSSTYKGRHDQEQLLLLNTQTITY